MDIIKKVAKLFEVKKIIALSLTWAFITMTKNGTITNEFLIIYGSIITFYFAQSVNKETRNHD